MTAVFAQSGFLSDIAALITAITALIAGLFAIWRYWCEHIKRREAEGKQKEAEQREQAAQDRNVELEQAIAVLQASLSELEQPNATKEESVDPKLAQQLVAAVNQLTSAVRQLQSDVTCLKQQNQTINQRLNQLQTVEPVHTRDCDNIDLVIDKSTSIVFTDEGQPVGMEEDKRAYLVGAEPKARKVHLLVKVHDYRGKAIYQYNLLTCTLMQEANSSSSDIDARIARYRQVGHKISHPNTIPYKDTRRWVDHALAEACRLGLAVGV